MISFAHQTAKFAHHHTMQLFWASSYMHSKDAFAWSRGCTTTQHCITDHKCCSTAGLHVLQIPFTHELLHNIQFIAHLGKQIIINTTYFRTAAAVLTSSWGRHAHMELVPGQQLVPASGALASVHRASR